MLVYRLTFSSGKIYIGQTVKAVEHRLNHHRNNVTAGSSLPVHNAWRKHGEPSVDVLMACATLDELNEAEARLIAEHCCIVPNGYNLSLGGNNAPKHPNTRAKISAKRTGFRYTDEQKEVFRRATAAKWQDPEYRARVTSGVEASFTAERRASIAAHAKRIHTGKIVSDETRAKLRARVVSDETRAKMSAAAKGKPKAPRSAETKAKISAAIKGSHNGKERGLAISAALQRRYAVMTEKDRANLSEVKKRAWQTRRAKQEIMK